MLCYYTINLLCKCHPPTCLVYLCPSQSSPWPSCIGNGMSVGYRINLGRHTATKSYSTEGAPLDGRPPTLPCKPICSFRSADLFLMARLVVAWSGVLHSSNSHQKHNIALLSTTTIHPHAPTSQATHNNHKILLVVLSGGGCFDQETTPNHESSFQSQVKHCSSPV